MGGEPPSSQAPSLAGGAASSPPSVRHTAEAGNAAGQQQHELRQPQRLRGLLRGCPSSSLPPLAVGVTVQLGAEAGLQSATDERPGTTVDEPEALHGVLVVGEHGQSGGTAGPAQATAAQRGRQALEQQQQREQQQAQRWEQQAAAAEVEDDGFFGGAYSRDGNLDDSPPPIARLTTSDALAALLATTGSREQEQVAGLAAALAGSAAPAEPGDAAWGPGDRQLMAAMLAQLQALRGELDTLRRRSYT